MAFYEFLKLLFISGVLDNMNSVSPICVTERQGRIEAGPQPKKLERKTEEKEKKRKMKEKEKTKKVKSITSTKLSKNVCIFLQGLVKLPVQIGLLKIH